VVAQSATRKKKKVKMANEFKTYIPVAISNPKLNTPQAVYAAQDH
jgi:hypothetical protein